MKGQTTEKYLSMAKEMVMYTLAVRLVWNMEVDMYMMVITIPPEPKADCRAQGTSTGSWSRTHSGGGRRR